MFQLEKPRDPEWRETVPGIRIQLRFSPSEALGAARRGARLAAFVGKTVEPAFAFTAGALVWAATAWEGVGDPEWEAVEGETCPLAPLTPENLVLLLQQRPDVFDDLASYYVDPLLELLAEKKGSWPSPNGTSETAQPSAPPAPQTAKSAHTRSKTPARTLAKGSGRPSKAVPGN